METSLFGHEASTSKFIGYNLHKIPIKLFAASIYHENFLYNLSKPRSKVVNIKLHYLWERYNKFSRDHGKVVSQ